MKCGERKSETDIMWRIETEGNSCGTESESEMRIEVRGQSHCSAVTSLVQLA